jgi:hypothetical protein
MIKLDYPVDDESRAFNQVRYLRYDAMTRFSCCVSRPG